MAKENWRNLKMPRLNLTIFHWYQTEFFLASKEETKKDRVQLATIVIHQVESLLKELEVKDSTSLCSLYMNIPETHTHIRNE